MIYTRMPINKYTTGATAIYWYGDMKHSTRCKSAVCHGRLEASTHEAGGVFLRQSATVAYFLVRDHSHVMMAGSCLVKLLL